MIQTKFDVGDKFYTINIKDTRKRHPCPDCLGTAKWLVTTPAGDTFETACHRCGSWTYSNIPKLDYNEYTFSVPEKPYTVVSISADGAGRIRDYAPDDNGIRYMAAETSQHGSGAVYYEKDCCATREEAEAIGALRVGALNAKENVVVQRIVAKYFSELHIKDAAIEAAEVSIHNAQRIWNEVEAAIQDDSSEDELRDETLKERIESALRYSRVKPEDNRLERFKEAS